MFTSKIFFLFKHLFFLDPNCIPSFYDAHGMLCGGRLRLELCIVVGVMIGEIITSEQKLLKDCIRKLQNIACLGMR